MTDEDYPTDYENAPTIEDEEEWLESRRVGEVAEDCENLHTYQIEFLAYKTDDQNKQAVLRAELGDRDGEAYGKKTERAEETVKQSFNNRTSGGSVWDSGLEIVESFDDLAEELIGARSLEQYAKKELGIEKNKVVVPEEVRKICVSLQNEVNEDYGSGCEFGVLFKGEWTSEGFKVKPDYVIPEQKVSRAHITYTEDLKSYRDEGYIVNVHSHPWAGHNSGFSGTDDDHINSHFDMAVLFAGGAETLVDAKANIETSDGMKVQIQPEVVVEEPEEDLPDVDIDNVETKNRGNYSKSGKRKKRRDSRLSRYHGSYGMNGRGTWKGNSPNYGDFESELPESPEDLDEEQQTVESSRYIQS